jgi:hypothetical protein
MKPVQPSEFERNCADAAGAPDVYGAPMIRTQMNKSDWTILGVLALTTDLHAVRHHRVLQQRERVLQRLWALLLHHSHGFSNLRSHSKG